MGIVIGLPWIVAGFWFVRNAWWTGNPLYPLQIEAMGRVWLRGWYGPEVMRLSQYYLPPSDWRSLLDILASVLDPRLLPIWALALAGLWRIGKRTNTDRHVGFVSALAVVNVALYWLLVPYRTQQRFMIQAVGLAAVPLARTFDRGRPARWLGVSLLALHVFTSQTWPFGAGEPPWDLNPRIPNAVAGLVRLPTLADFPGGLLPTLLVLTASVGIGLASFGAVWTWARVANSRTRKDIAVRVTAAVGATLTLAATAAGLSYPWSTDARRAFFPTFPTSTRAGWRSIAPRGRRARASPTPGPTFLTT